MTWPGRGAPAASRPSSASRATSRFPSVAESPSIRSAGRKRRRRARASSVCTPRFDPSSSCHSSTTTSSRWSNSSGASSRVSSSDRLSGVVTSAVGSRSRWRARMRAGVSPVRDSTVHGSPRSSTGARRAASVSAASARSGVIQRTRSGGAPAFAAGAPRIVSQPFEHRPDPRRVGLAGAGGRVDQAALTGEVRAPGLLLERERASNREAGTTRARTRAARGRPQATRYPRDLDLRAGAAGPAARCAARSARRCAARARRRSTASAPPPPRRGRSSSGLSTIRDRVKVAAHRVADGLLAGRQDVAAEPGAVDVLELERLHASLRSAATARALSGM